MDQIKLFHPPAAHDTVVAGNGEADSQDSLDILGGWERLEMILVSLMTPLFLNCANYCSLCDIMS
jgi:hypothetical protein